MNYDERPFFSVILATKDRADLLPGAVESLFRQTMIDWELWIVDDGSTDDTPLVVSSLTKRDERVKYHAHEPCGVARSRNEGALRASGHYLTFLDSDDAYLADHLQIRRDLIEGDRSVDMWHGGYIVVGQPYVPDKRNPAKLVHIDTCFVDATMCISRDTFLALDGFPDLPFSAGSALFDKMKNLSKRIKRVSAPTYIYKRTAGDSVCTRMATTC